MRFGKSSKPEGKSSKPEGKTDKQDHKHGGGGFSWFETSVNGGVHVLRLLKETSSRTPVPYLSQAAGAALVIIQIAQVRFRQQDRCVDFAIGSQDDNVFRMQKITRPIFDD